MMLAELRHESGSIGDKYFLQFWMRPTMRTLLYIVMREAVLACQVTAERAFPRCRYSGQKDNDLLPPPFDS